MSSPVSDSSPAAGPLSGLRVVDWTHVLAGPFTGYQLALLGAEVIRIERPDTDDLIRSKALDPALAAQGLGETFVAQGAGKRSLAIDARDPASHKALQALIASADVLLENFRPGKLAALGFDPAELIRQHPRLVVCSITGFGPASDRRAYDHVIQAASGLMQANATADGTPQRIGFPLVDYAVGQQAALAVTTALLRRERTAPGERIRGEWLQVSMMGAALSLMAPVYAPELVSGLKAPRSRSTAFSGSPLSGTFPVSGGHLAIVCNAREQAEGLMAALREAGATEETMQSLARSVDAGQVDEAQSLMSAELSREDGPAWVERFDRHGVPVAIAADAIAAVRSVCQDWPQVDLPLPAGAARSIQVPGIGFASTEPLTVGLGSPPRRGSDTRRLLEQAGLPDSEIDRLIREGKVHEPQP